MVKKHFQIACFPFNLSTDMVRDYIRTKLKQKDHNFCKLELDRAHGEIYLQNLVQSHGSVFTMLWTFFSSGFSQPLISVLTCLWSSSGFGLRFQWGLISNTLTNAMGICLLIKLIWILADFFWYFFLVFQFIWLREPRK